MQTAIPKDVEALARYLRQTAPFLGGRGGRDTGIEVLDRLVPGGLPLGALTVVSGLAGSGRATVAAHVLAQETRAGRPVAWVDPRKTLYPPALAQAGVALERLLLVRSDPERSVYAAERILESGAFRVVAIGGLERHLGPSRVRRLQTAAERADTVALLLTDETCPLRGASALELRTERRAGGVLLTVVRDRAGPSGRRALMSVGDPIAPAA